MYRSLTIVLTLFVLIAGCGLGSEDDASAPTETPASRETATSEHPPATATSTPTAPITRESSATETLSPERDPTATTPPDPRQPETTATPSLKANPTYTFEPRQEEPAPYVPDVDRPEDQQVRLPDLDLHYRVHVTEMNVESGLVLANQTIEIQEFRGDSPDQLFLQVVPAGYGFFTLNGLSLNGEPVEPVWINDGFTLVIDLPDDITAPATIETDFRLDVGGPEPSGWGYIARDADILRLGYWFPQISDDHQFSLTLDPSYTRVATFDVTLDLAAGIDFAHSGELTSAKTLDDGRRRYQMHGENIRDFDLTVSPGYEMVTGQSAGGVNIEYYWRPGQTADVTEQVLATTADALDRLSELIGPYPWPTLRVADAGPSMPGGIEYGNLIWINPEYPELDRLIYHEVAHMWFYGIIGTRTLIEGWVDEGAAEFFERGLPTDFTEVPEPPGGGYCCPLDSRWEELPQEGSDYYFAVYEQGARFYYDVLNTMGWEPFWAAMQEIYDTYQFEIVTAYDMLRVWQEHSEADLRPLYRDYFRYDWIDDLPDPGITGQQGWLPITPAAD
ncbi:MAG: hypothetical protein ACOC9Y_09505 [Chloroflexota bacterium]